MPNPAFSPSVPLVHQDRYIPRLTTLPHLPRAPTTHQPARFTSLISVDKNYHSATQSVGQSTWLFQNGTPFSDRAEFLVQDGSIPPYVADTLLHWYGSYRVAVSDNTAYHGDPDIFTETMFTTLLELTRRAIENPFVFRSYHERLREPFDYYKFGLDFVSVLLNQAQSTIIGDGNMRKAQAYAQQGHNVVFLSNHQSEGDPYAIDSLLDWLAGCDRSFCETMIFMAGDRVRNDPVVSPFSAGRNLLTVYSKKHINDIPEEREQKLLHNRRTISETQKLFQKGGKVVWFAPSGGRDRKSEETGRVEIADFDDGAVDMMRFTAMKSGTPCHFFPMALWTYDMLPPPSGVGGSQLGEERVVKYTPMRMYVGEEIDWSQSVPPHVKDKFGVRKARCEYVERIVRDGYAQLGG